MRSASASARRARPLLGTFVEIASGGAPRPDLDRAIEGAFRAVARVHRLMSPREPDSDVSRLNRDASAPVHPWTAEVLRTARALHEGTDGRFDISVPSGIDLGGIAKGFAVDRALACLKASELPWGLVNAGGDLAVFGPDASVVDIRDPRQPGRILCRVELRNEALASSGGRFDPCVSSEPGESAVVDPGTGAPSPAIRGATVRAPSCMLADALTKVVMLAGVAAGPLLGRHGASALFVAADGALCVTRGWAKGVHVAA